MPNGEYPCIPSSKLKLQSIFFKLLFIIYSIKGKSAFISWSPDIKDSLKQGNDKFREQNETNEVLLNSTLALIEFEIQYCLTENKHISPELQKAKENLHTYLSKRK